MGGDIWDGNGANKWMTALFLPLRPKTYLMSVKSDGIVYNPARRRGGETQWKNSEVKAIPNAQQYLPRPNLLTSH
jgi:hypothetical protein